ALFQGSALTGNCCVNLVSFESFGPDAFSWDPDNLTNNQTIITQFYYPASNPLMPWASTNPVWNDRTKIVGMVFLENTRTILYVGTHGTGTWCYGAGTTCGDPVFPNTQGEHAYPYQYQMWAYDANDLQQVMAGQRPPYSVLPYARWTFDL